MRLALGAGGLGWSLVPVGVRCTVWDQPQKTLSPAQTGFILVVESSTGPEEQSCQRYPRPRALVSLLAQAMEHLDVVSSEQPAQKGGAG